MLSISKSLRSLPVLLGVLAVVACADDPVTTPGGEPIVFQGLLRDGDTTEVPLVLDEEGTIRITATELTPLFIQLPPTGELPAVSIGVAIGDPGPGGCGITFGTSLAEGENLTVLVEDANKCLVFFDDQSLPPDAVVRYTVTVDDVKS